MERFAADARSRGQPLVVCGDLNVARADWATVDAHVAAIRAEAPELEGLYLTLAEATRP
jgi:exonuclease III